MNVNKQNLFFFSSQVINDYEFNDTVYQFINAISRQKINKKE